MATIKKACKGALYPKSSSVSRKLKSGGGFPDLNKDNKITKADVLIGRGVIPKPSTKTAKKGTKVKKAQVGRTQGRSSKNIDYELNAPLTKGTNRDRNLTNTTRQDMRMMRFRNKDANNFIGPLTKLKSQTSTEDRGTDMTSPNYYLSNKARLDRQQKNGGKTKSAPKKMTMKKGGKMKAKKCAYGCK